MSSNRIAYSGNEDSSDNSYNEVLDIHVEKHSLQWRAQMGSFSGRDPAKGLSQEGAAEHLWTMLMAPLQQSPRVACLREVRVADREADREFDVAGRIARGPT